MRILLTGANGFIGSHIAATLLADGHHLVAAVRQPEKFKARFPAAAVIAIDMNVDTQVEAWLPRLKGIDAVINCAGVLHTRHGQRASAIHTAAPSALFDAAAKSGVHKVIQISAIGTDATTEFASTKLAADEHLQSLPVEWTILRPSIVYGRYSYGGTSMLRALAAFPVVLPLIGQGKQPTTPIHVDDICNTVLLALASDKLSRQIIYPCGPETMTLRDLVLAYRSWLGLASAPVLPISRTLLWPAAQLGNVIGSGPLTTTSLSQLEHGTACDPKAFSAATGLRPVSLAAALSNQPSSTADLWHARLYLIRPLVRATLILLWAFSALAGFLAPLAVSQQVLAPLGLEPGKVQVLAYASSALDALIALALLFNWRPLTMPWVQVAVVLTYTMGLTLLQPSLWLEPFGALLKNLPILALVLVSRILEEER